MQASIPDVVVAPLLALASDWASTVSFSSRDSEPFLSSDVHSQLVALAQVGTVSSSPLIKLYAASCSRVANRYPSLAPLFVRLSSNLVLRLEGLPTHSVAIADMLDHMRRFINRLVVDPNTLTAVGRTASIGDVERAACWMLRGVHRGSEIAEAVAKALALCSEGDSLYPNRIFVTSMVTESVAILPGLLIDRYPTSLMRHARVDLPARVLVLTCGVEEDEVGIILRLVEERGIQIVASQRVISSSVQFLLAECGVLSIDRLSIHRIQPFALVTGSALLGSLDEASEAHTSAIGQVSEIGAFNAHTILIRGGQGPSRIHTLVIPQEGCRCFTKLTQECIQMCAGLFASPEIIVGEEAFERFIVANVSENADLEGWGEIVLQFVEAMRDTFGDDFSPVQPDRVNINAVEPVCGRHLVIDEALSLASTLLRIQGVESLS